MDERERLTRLEERYAHLQRHSAEQDKVMLALAEEVAKLRREIVRLQALQARPADPADGDLPIEKPPHY